MSPDIIEWGKGAFTKSTRDAIAVFAMEETTTLIVVRKAWDRCPRTQIYKLRLRKLMT